MKHILIATAVVAAAFAVGCRKSNTYQSADGSVTIEQSEDSTRYEFRSGDGKGSISSGGKAVAIPDSFPKDVPIPKGAVAKLSMTQDKSELLHLYLAGSAASIGEKYAADLKEAGWVIESSMNTGEGSVISASKDERQCNAVVVTDGDGSMIQLSIGPK